MELVSEILNKLLDAAELDSPEWDRITAACEEVENMKNHLKAVKTQQEATSNALYNLQFVTHENLINKYIELRKYAKESGLDIPPKFL
jgi:hypothetical protein